MNIRARVIVLVLVSALPLVGASVYEAKTAERAARAKGQQEALLLARGLAALHDQGFDDTRSLLAGFSAGLQGAAPGSGACGTGLQRLLTARPEHHNFVLADANGDLVCAARALSAPINVADRRYFRDALGGKDYVLSDMIVSRDSGNPVVVAAHPVAGSGGEVSAVVLATFTPEALGRMFERVGAPEYLVANLVNGVGKVLARWPHAPQYIGRTLVDFASLPGISRLDEGIAELAGFDGKKRVSAYVRLRAASHHDLYVVAGIPEEELERGPRAMLLRHFLWLAATVAVVLVLGLLGSHMLVVRPLRRLTAAADRHRHGDLGVRSGLSHGEDEIGRLAATFDGLAEQNQRVTRALKTLSAGNQTLLRERDESALLHAMCRVAVERGGYAAAFVCYPRHDEAKGIDVVAQQGAGEGFLSAAPLTWADTELGQTSIARCMRSGERVVLHSITAAPDLAPWHAAARASGFKSVMSLPLRVQATLIGTFTLYTREEGAFDDAEVELLAEMAADLSFGIEVIRAEARRRQAEQIARRALTHDSVVDLPNRTAFLGLVQECIRRAQGNGEPVAVLDVHLGRLQDIVDSFGYEHANAALREVAGRLREVPGCQDVLGRLPIDDFGIVLCAHDARAAEAVARAALDIFRVPVNIGGALVDVQATVGATFFPGHGDDPEMLLRRASIAAREGFRREVSYQVYGGATARENPARLALAADLRGAIETRALQLHYQPKIHLASGAHCGSEALVRWQHPQRGMVSPLEFVGLAEEIGLIRPLTYQVLDLAVRQQQAWGAAGDMPVAVNLSARNLLDPALFDALDGLFGTWGVQRELIHFEITESALVDDPEAARRAIMRLGERGAQVYIDDFGTGYSSLNYLVKLPVHALKIDRSFVQQMTRSAEARSIVASIISMAHNLGLKVVAEGVETGEDAATLRDMGCDEAQGYFFARPLDPAAHQAWHSKR